MIEKLVRNDARDWGRRSGWRVAAGLAAILPSLLLALAPLRSSGTEAPPAVPGLEIVGEYAAPGLESELAGIHPHPTDDSLYLALANREPVYVSGQAPLLPKRYRGDLLTVDKRTGKVVAATALPAREYGGMAYGDGHLFVSSTQASEILKIDLASGAVKDRFATNGPAGGLEYDAEEGVLLAQVFTGHPHLEVIDARTGTIRKSLWSDESAMGLARVGGDLLCTWSNSLDDAAFGELRLLDRGNGRVLGRVRIDAIHTSMSPTRAEKPGFISLVALDRTSGRAAVREYRYDGERVPWQR